MPTAYVDANQFAQIWLHAENRKDVHERTGITAERALNRRRRRVEHELGITLPPHKLVGGRINQALIQAKSWPEIGNVVYDRVSDFNILIGSDRHNIPGDTPQAFKAFLHLAEEIKPHIIVINGDWFDFSAIGRFHRIGWQNQPDISEELEDGTDKLNQVKAASPKSRRIFVPGNHDDRFDGIISNRLPQFENVPGHALEHHLKKDWRTCSSLVINDNTIIKHRYHGGIQAAYNNVLRGGQNMVTGHTHRLMIRPWTDYGGTRYGVETGTLSDLWDETFMWKENNPSDWQPGCVVLNFSGSRMIPETCPLMVDQHHKYWGKIFYRGRWYG